MKTLVFLEQHDGTLSKASLGVLSKALSLGGEVAVTDMAEHVLAREPAPLGEALGEVLRGEGIELMLSANTTGARRDGDDYVLELDDGRELKGDRLLVGFAAETENLVEEARRKLQSKNCDMVVANLVSQEGTGFESD